MKTLFYIRNTKNDKNFDTIENKFFDSNWDPQYEDDKRLLEILIEDDAEKFENCVIEEIVVDED